MRFFKRCTSMLLTLVLVLMLMPMSTEAATKYVKMTNSVSQLDVGMEYTFVARKSGVKGNISYSVSNKKIASIDANSGEFFAKKCGKVTVTAKVGKIKATKRVTIIGNKVTVTEKKYEKIYKAKKKSYCSITGSYPVLSGRQAGIQTVNKMIKKEFNKWKNNHDEFLANAKEFAKTRKNTDVIYGDDTDFKITYNRNNIINVLESGYEFSGGAHGTPYRKNLIYNLKTGKAVTIYNVKKGTKESIEKEIYDAYSDLINDESDRFNPDALETVGNTALDDFKWYLTPKGIVVYFEPYVIAPYAYGFAEVTIPMK